MCQLGLSTADQDALTSLISSYSSAMATAVFGASSRRKRAAAVTPSYTCAKLTQLGKGATALSATQLSSINSTEFAKCITTLGAITKWSAGQLSALATLALKVKNSFNFHYYLIIVITYFINLRIMDQRLN